MKTESLASMNDPETFNVRVFILGDDSLGQPRNDLLSLLKKCTG